MTLSDGDGRFGFGVFDHYVDPPMIGICAGLARIVLKETGADRHGAAMAVVETLIHELIHYRQWCEHGKCWERGMIGETRRTMKKLGML